MKDFLKDKKRVTVIALAAAVLISATGYAMTVSGFDDYNPPSTLILRWGDYFTNDTVSEHQTTSNNVTSWKYWSADYPYRAIFFGGQSSSTQEQKHRSYMFIVYSKKPVADIFTFEYIADKTSSRTGYIRALYDKSHSDDFRVTVNSWSGVQAGSIDIHAWNQVTYVYGSHVIGNKAYFDFDFYYKCSGSHQQNAYSLNVNGVTSVSGVPYPYILSCDNHSGGGTAESGDSSGGSSGGSESSGGSGSGGRPPWGNGPDGGGVDRDDIVSPDMDISVPDDWESSHEDNYNGGLNSEYTPNYPEYVPAEGDTGQNGSDWELPTLDPDNDGVTGEIDGYKDFDSDGDWGLHELPPGLNFDGYKEFKSDSDYGLIDFMNP